MKNKNDFKIKSTPYLIVINNFDSIAIEGNLLTLQTNKLSSILSKDKSFTKTKSIKLNENIAILNIDQFIYSNENKCLYFLDNIQDKIFSVNYIDPNLKVLFTLDKYLSVLNGEVPQVEIDLKNIKKPRSTIKGFIPEIGNENVFNIIVETYGTKMEIDELDTAIYFIPSILLLKFNSISQESDVYKNILLQDKIFSFDYNTVFFSGKSYYITGRNIPECNQYPHSEIPDSTYILFKFDKNFEVVNSLLPIKSINEIHEGPFYSFFASNIIYNDNQYILYNLLNAAFLSFSIQDNNTTSTIKSIEPSGLLKEYFDEIKQLNLTPQKLIEDISYFNIKSKYVLKNMICTTDKILVQLNENDQSEHIIGIKVQYYNYKGAFIGEFSIPLKGDEKLIDSKIISSNEEKVYFLLKYKDSGWYFTEYFYK